MKNLITKFALFGLTAILTACGSQSNIQPSFDNQVVQQPVPARKVSSSSFSETASFVRFDVKNSEVQNFIRSKGYDKRYKVSVNKADLVYTTDNWKNTLTSQKQYLIDNTEGFILRNTAPGSEIEFSVHAWLCMSTDGFRSCDQKDELWVNNNHKNYHTQTTAK